MEEDKKECMIMTCWRRLTVGQGVFILFVFTATLIIKFWMVYGGWNEVRTIGDTKFDAMSALFSGLAFAGLICTILLQQFELKATREELHNAAEANRAAANAAEKTLEIAKKQIKAQYYSTLIPFEREKLYYYIDKHPNMKDLDTTAKEMRDLIDYELEEFQKIADIVYPDNITKT